MRRRVVITGLGAITPVGNNVNDFWNSIKEGKNGIDKITHFDTSEFKVKLAAEVKDFNLENYMDKKQGKRMDRFSQFAMAAAKEAILDSKIDLENYDRERISIIFGSGIGGIETIQNQIRVMDKKGPSRISPLAIPMVISNIAAGNIAIEYGIKGSCISMTTACATSSHCIGEAFRNIRDGYSDMVISGGTEASITEFSIGGFQTLTALSKSEDRNRASIPFDKDRNGFVMGEGAAIVILEELESALKRGAKIYGEIVGYGTTCDAYHMTSPSIDGEGAARSMTNAIKDSGITPKDIGYINAHGTSTEANDKFETLAIKKSFGDCYRQIPVSSTKSMTGHLLGAAGAIEAIISIKSVEDGFIPATINYLNSDENCDLNLVVNNGQVKEIEYSMSNSLGFGGHNATLIFKKWRNK